MESYELFDLTDEAHRLIKAKPASREAREILRVMRDARTLGEIDPLELEAAMMDFREIHGGEAT